jgi:hypothetical protein
MFRQCGGIRDLLCFSQRRSVFNVPIGFDPQKKFVLKNPFNAPIPD